MIWGAFAKKGPIFISLTKTIWWPIPKGKEDILVRKNPKIPL